MNNIALKKETRILSILVNDYLSFEIATKIPFFSYNKLVIFSTENVLVLCLSVVFNIFEYSFKFHISAESVTYLKYQLT